MIFDDSDVDRIASAALVAALLAVPDGLYNEWRGPNDDRPSARKLTQSSLAEVLRLFGIRPHSLWPRPRQADSKSFRGYERIQFEAAWAAYCAQPVTPSQPSKIIGLPRRKSSQ